MGLAKVNAVKVRQRQAGTSLVEVLISVLLFGLLCTGSLSVQMQTARSALNVSSHAQAVLLADDLIERIRLNPAGWPEAYLQALKGQQQDKNGPDCYQRPCNALELARWDLSELYLLMNQSLVGDITLALEPVCRGAESYSCIKLAWEGYPVSKCTESTSLQGARNCIRVEFIVPESARSI